MGRSDHAIAQIKLIGRSKCGAVRAIAERNSWLAGGPLPFCLHAAPLIPRPRLPVVIAGHPRGLESASNRSFLALYSHPPSGSGIFEFNGDFFNRIDIPLIVEGADEEEKGRQGREEGEEGERGRQTQTIREDADEDGAERASQQMLTTTFRLREWPSGRMDDVLRDGHGSRYKGGDRDPADQKGDVLRWA